MSSLRGEVSGSERVPFHSDTRVYKANCRFLMCHAASAPGGSVHHTRLAELRVPVNETVCAGLCRTEEAMETLTSGNGPGTEGYGAVLSYITALPPISVQYQPAIKVVYPFK